jgi:hypothetical protein
LENFQEFLNATFMDAPDVYTIQEETSIGSNTYANITVRINAVINQVTGKNRGDDWRNLLFSDITHKPSIGTKYKFDDNYYLTVNSEVRQNFATSVTVRRCNTMLRWMTEDGVYYEEPAVFDYEISRPRDLVGTENLPLPAGFTLMFCQGNTRTKTIKGNKRFLFGPVENRVAFRIFGNGVNNYLNSKTTDDATANLLEFSVGGNFVNPDVDNITLGIADYYKDYGNLTSGSSIGAISIVATPNQNYILESGSALFDVRYHSGSFIGSGSFVFSVANANVPMANYVFAQESANTFSVYNLTKYPNDTLDVLCSGSSGSRILNLELRGKF